MAAKYEIALRCGTCGHKYRRRVNSLDDPDPPCPRCETAARTRGIDFASSRAPAVIGSNVHVRAIDATAQIVMEDHKLGDLRSDVRPGETAAPKIAPHLQKQADNFFMGRKSMAGNPMQPIFARAAAAAMSGAARDGTPDVVGATHKAKMMPKTRFIAGDGVSGGSEGA